MSALAVAALACVTLLVAIVGAAARIARRRNLHRWWFAALTQPLRRGPRQTEQIHVLLCIADHYEPCWGGADPDTARERVAAWTNGYEPALGRFRDSDGRPPRHTFFYPIDEYVAEHVDAIAELCRRGYGEVEIHLHHDNDTAENLTRTLTRFTELLSRRHGLLGRWPDGRVAYGFVHGNWALDNSRPDGRWCGVPNELSILQRTGCYGDFTLPSAPDATQTKTVNQIYRAAGREGCCKSHDVGIRAGCGSPGDGLLIVQGPLRLWWPKGSRSPRIENGCVQACQVPTMARFAQWLRAGIHVPQRPDWRFVKLHTHGAIDSNRQVLLGPAMTHVHEALAQRAQRDRAFQYHYVTAREMYNLVRAAESGWTGSVKDALDYELAPPPAETLPCARKSVDRPSQPEVAGSHAER
jgi:hypothetical protein